jgi:hypothetical protein
MQMRATRNANQLERRDSQDIRQKYKEELDMIIQLKQSQIQMTKDSKHKEADFIAKSVQNCQELEEQHKKYKRDRERKLITESQLGSNLRKEELVRNKNEEEMNERENLRESMNLHTMLMNEKKQKHQQEIESFKNHYNETRIRKNDEKEEERRRNKHYYEEEQKNLEKMERDNFEFIQNIRNRLSKNKDVLDFYERLHANVTERNRTEYQRTIEKPILEHMQKELEKERLDLLSRKQMKNENTNFIQDQIEKNTQKKEMLMYEQAKIDYEMLVEDLERQDQMDHETKIAKKQKLLEILNTLKSQIEHKSSDNAKINNMNMHESRINDIIQNNESGLVDPGQIGCSIPGFVMPHERKRQLSVMDQSMKLNNHFLTNAINLKQTETFKNSSMSRRMTFQPNITKSHLFNKENHNKQPNDSSSDYQFISYRHKNGAYNIISNDAKNY